MLVKPPQLRVRSSSDIERAFHQGFADDCFAWAALTPFADLITDLCEVGSFACERAELHSDMDINIEFQSESDIDVARERIAQNKDQFLKSIEFRNSLWRKYGTRIYFVMFDYQLALTPKSYFSLKEMKHYVREKRRMDKKPDGTFAERPPRPRLRPPRLGVIVHDEETDSFRPFDPSRDTHDKYDPWYAELPEWRKRLGKKLLEYGDTEETSWLKP